MRYEIQVLSSKLYENNTEAEEMVRNGSPRVVSVDLQEMVGIFCIFARY